MKQENGEFDILDDNIYDINTKEIYCHLRGNWDGIDRGFLINAVMPALILALKNLSPKIVSNDYEERCVRYSNETDKIESFPIPPMYLVDQQEKENTCSIIIFDEMPYIVLQNDRNFDLFFALQLYATDIMEIDMFLEYQFKKNFENNIASYHYFLERIKVKYDFLKERHSQIVSLYLRKAEPDNTTKPNNITENLTEENPIEIDITARRQVMAILYLLDQLNVAQVDKTIKARFIQFLTGNELGAKAIANTNIYKWISNPLASSDKNADKDLKAIRVYFEGLELQSIVDKINNEIKSK